MKIGEIVILKEYRNGSWNDEVAIVTRVWDEDCVNVKVLPDCDEPYDRTSVHLGIPNGLYYIEKV